jgi:hypothetical protein
MATRRDDLNRSDSPDANPDPITGAPGSHPVGTGVGAAGGGAAGAAIGAMGGPVGAAVGAVVGAVAGGLAGKGAAEAVNPTAEDAYWRQNYQSRPYYESNYTYDDDYRPAYEYGWQTRSQHSGRRFDDVEGDLQRGWEKTKAKSRLGWEKAKHATRDAWDRLENAGSAGRGSTGAYPGQSSGSVSDVDTFAASCRTRYAGRSFDDAEMDLRRDWDSSHRGTSGGDTWDNVRDSVRRAWHKVERAMPGDADRDGR